MCGLFINHILTCVRQGYIDPVVSKEKTISTGPPEEGVAVDLVFFGSTAPSSMSLAAFGSSALFLFNDKAADSFFPTGLAFTGKPLDTVFRFPEVVGFSSSSTGFALAEERLDTLVPSTAEVAATVCTRKSNVQY